MRSQTTFFSLFSWGWVFSLGLQFCVGGHSILLKYQAHYMIYIQLVSCMKFGEFKASYIGLASPEVQQSCLARLLFFFFLGGANTTENTTEQLLTFIIIPVIYRLNKLLSVYINYHLIAVRRSSNLPIAGARLISCRLCLRDLA